jgi:serine/threonine protein kinase
VSRVDYLAPEVVSGQGHGKGVDWWTLGVLVYEMLASYPPFYDEDPMRTYAKIMRGELHFPSHFSRAAVDLVRRLLHPKPTKRLGVTAGGASIIRQHPFFLGFDWEAFERMEMKAPIIMRIKSLEDLSNFEKYPDDDGRIEPYVPDLKHPDWTADF